MLAWVQQQAGHHTLRVQEEACGYQRAVQDNAELRKKQLSKMQNTFKQSVEGRRSMSEQQVQLTHTGTY
eukprot:4520730-Amphidinium_carterae.2